MNRNSVIALLVGVVLGVGGYYIVDRIASAPGPMPVDAEAAALGTEEPLAEVAAEEATEPEPLGEIVAVEEFGVEVEPEAVAGAPAQQVADPAPKPQPDVAARPDPEPDVAATPPEPE